MVRPNARTITTAMFEAGESVGTKYWKQKLIALGSDGAAVMQGRSCVGRGGECHQLLEVAYWVVVIHCSAHRLELVIKKAIQGMNLTSDIDKLLLDLYLFYPASTVRRATLTNPFVVHAAQHSNKGRWFKMAEPHTLCPDDTVESYRGVITHLQKVK